MLVSLKKGNYQNQYLSGKYQNLIVQKMEKYLNDSVNTDKENVAFLLHDIVHC